MCKQRETLQYLGPNSLLGGSSLCQLRHQPDRTGWSQRFQLEGRAAQRQDFLTANKTEYHTDIRQFYGIFIPLVNIYSVLLFSRFAISNMFRSFIWNWSSIHYSLCRTLHARDFIRFRLADQNILSNTAFICDCLWCLSSTRWSLF